MIRKRIVPYAVVASAIIVVVTQTGCAGMATANQDFVLAGNAAGIHAFADTLNGVIRTGKETNTDASRYFNSREVLEKEKTKREVAPGFLSKLFGPSSTNTGGSLE
jgi:L-asparagine transporter-like permease